MSNNAIYYMSCIVAAIYVVVYIVWKSVFEKRYGKHLNVDVKYCDVKSNYCEI